MMDGIYQSWQNGVMWACLGMLGVMAVGIILYGFGQAWDKVREWWSLPLIERVLAGVFVVGFAYYGSTKHGAPSVRWDDGLADNGTLITNDTVQVRWTYSGIPGASSVFIDYRLAGSTNKWANLAETLASSLGWTGTLADATNYEYWVYSTYVPPVPVHTNGVWVGQAYETKARVGAKSFLILNGLVQEHGRTIATPAAKRREEATYSRASLLAMWDGIDHGNDPLIWRDLSGNGFDATQRVATGWSWADKSYVGVGNSNGFSVPLTFSSALRDAVEHHTVELVFKPNSWRRMSIFGQYNGNVGAGLSYEFYNRPQSFRAYYYAMPDYSVGVWSSAEMQRRTVAVVCDGSKLSMYADGEKLGQSYQPTANTIHEGLSMIIGSENSQANMSIGGALFCVRVYSRALTEEELKRHVKIDNERFN